MMWKRVNENKTGRKERAGFTLLEMMAVVAIVVILCGIAIISAGAITKTLQFQEYNDYAKTIFMAAQSNLSQMRGNGELVKLRAPQVNDVAITPYLRDATDFPNEEWSAEYVFTSSELEADSAEVDSYGMVLPANSVESAIRDQKVIIEYNPVTGNVYAVFYSQKGENLLDLYLSGQLPRDEATRKELGLGYYCGSGLSSQNLEQEQTSAKMEFINGQEGILNIELPIPGSLASDGEAFINGLDVTLTLTGEISGKTMELDILTRDGDDLAATSWEYGNIVRISYTMDSLADYCSFANFSNGTYGGDTSLTAVTGQNAFTFLPGENLTIQSKVTFTGSTAAVDIAPGILSGVNPMFEYLEPSGTPGKYVLAVSNGRNLQNLNALVPSIADAVELVVFSEDIYWNETVNYYNRVYGDGDAYSNAASEAPARSLPYFVPIHNELLLGTAGFDGTTLKYGHEMSASDNSLVFRDYADVVGNGHMVVGLNIDSTRYSIPAQGKYYVTNGYIADNGSKVGGNQIVNYNFTGLFAYANTNIRDLNVVNSFVKGMDFGSNRTVATGSLVGVAGPNAVLSNCGAYILTNPNKVNGYYSYSAMSGPAVYDASASQSWYGVSGEGAVGGLVGYTISHHFATGDLTDSSGNLAFIRCFAAVPVSGNMRGNGNDNYGYTNGIGGLAGVSRLSNFFSCYASGDVLASGVYVSSQSTDWTAIKLNGKTSMGCGGFIGTSHGSRFSNCFASGDVTGNGNAGVGGFVGVMTYDDSFECKSGSVTKTMKQLTILDSCYCVGQVTSGNNKVENFAGGIAQVALRNLIGSGGKVYTDYYLMYAPYCNDAGVTSGSAAIPDLYAGGGGYFYMYKDCYYLVRGKNDTGVAPNSSGIGGGASYSCLMDALANHGAKDNAWMASQVITYYLNSFWLAPGYYGELLEGYPSASWIQATENITHAYSFANGTYLFPMISGLEYYGDWPTFPLSGGLAYYEYYSDSGSIYAQFDREDTGNLATAEQLRNRSAYVVSDGYAVVAGNDSQDVRVTVGGKTFTLYNYNAKYWNYGTETMVLYPLTQEVLSEAVNQMDEEGYYVQLTISIGSATYTVYFNPNVANSQVNPVMISATKYSNPARPASTPNYIQIRSARQLAALSTMDSCWTRDYRYVQVLDIRANAYSATGYSDADKNTIMSNIANAGSIGTESEPFMGSYSGFGGTQTQTAISGYKTGTPGGIFGVMSGTVSNLEIVSSAVSADSGNLGYVGIVADVNTGTLDNVDVTINGAITMHAGTGVGLLAGRSMGIIKNCDVRANQSVSLQANYAGGAVGELDGTVTDCSVIIKGEYQTTASNCGGFAGVVAGKTKASVRNVTIKVDGEFKVSDQSGIIPEVGGFAGAINYGRYTNISVALNGAISGSEKMTAGGLAAVTHSSEFDGVSVSISGVLRGKVTAGLIGNVSNSVIGNSSVAVSGTIDGADGAAGLVSVLAVDSSVSGTVVNLNGGKVLSNAGKASGFIGDAQGVCTGCEVRLQNGTISGAQASGFANLVSGEVSGYCAVTGMGSIFGSGEAAGFAIQVSGTVAAGRVTPANAHKPEGYWQNSNNALWVRGNTAAGFAVTLQQSASVRNCDVLCSIEGSKAAGFAYTNKGSIDGCIANVTMSSGHAFVKDNSGSVKNCYGWYGDGAASNSTLVPTNGGYTSCYFVDIDINEEKNPSAKSVALFDHQGNYTTMRPSELTSAFGKLNGDTVGKWYIPGTYAGYPYSQTGGYPFPMLREHCGDWSAATVYFYGVVYYEGYQDSSYKFHVVELSTAEEGEIGSSFYWTDGKTQGSNCFDNSGVITSAGYLLFCKGGSDPFGGNLIGQPFTDTDIIQNTINSMADSAVYEVYQLNTTEKFSFVSMGQTVDVYPYYADAIGVSGTYQIRTPYQLAHINKVAANFSQTCDITLSGDFNTVESGVVSSGASIGAGYAYNGNGYTINATKADNTWIRTLSGTLQSVEIVVGGLSSELIADVRSNGVVSDVSLILQENMPSRGAFFGATSGKIDIRSLYIHATVMEGKLVNGINGGSFNINLIEAKASGSTVETLFGDITGGVVSGNTIDLSKANIRRYLFNSVTEGATLKDFAVSADSLRYSLIGTLTGTVDGISVETDNATIGSDSGVLISTVKQGVDSTGNTIANVIRNCKVSITTVNVTADCFGSITGTLPASAIVSNCEVAIDTIKFDGSTVGGMIGVNQGALTDNIVDVGIAAWDVSVAGGLAGSSNGIISGNMVDVDIRYTQTQQERANAVIGGLVGQVDGGSISGKADAVTVTGNIELLEERVNTANRRYVVGGVIGKDSGTAVATYSNLHANVAVDDAWKSIPDDSMEDLAQKGPVGMFVGHIGKGNFKNCSNSAANSIYEFAGEITCIWVETKNSNWFSHGSYNSGALTFEMDASERISHVAAANGFAALVNGQRYKSFAAKLDGCTYVRNNQKYQQIINTRFYLFTAEADAGQNNAVFTFEYAAQNSMSSVVG